MTLEADLKAARALDVAELADAIESIGFECTRCGACCRGHGEDHTATIFPDEVRALTDGDREWRNVARPMPFGLDSDVDGAPAGETLEWALQVDDCGDCTFYEGGDADTPSRCTVHDDRPLICRTYPFSVASLGASDAELTLTTPMGAVVDREGAVRAHDCEGLGREIPRERAERLAAALKERAIRDCVEAIGLRDTYEASAADGVVVHDSEGAKRPDGRPLDP